jgi:hypothetical protein
MTLPGKQLGAIEPERLYADQVCGLVSGPEQIYRMAKFFGGRKLFGTPTLFFPLGNFAERTYLVGRVNLEGVRGSRDGDGPRY